jgi:hypothetical protein
MAPRASHPGFGVEQFSAMDLGVIGASEVELDAGDRLEHQRFKGGG